MARTVTLLGRARLEKKLKALPGAARDAIRAEMEKQATAIVEMAKGLVPVETGDLRDSIGWTWGRAPKGAMVLARAKAALGADLSLTIYAGNSEAYYARWVEFGTQKMSAQPYFFVSYRANKRGAKNAIRRAVRNAARKVAGNG